MRRLLATLAVAGLASPAAAEPNTTLMDLSLGSWVLASGNGTYCSLTLGDEPLRDSRALSGGGDCRTVDPVMAQATAWRIDEPSELVFLNDSGKVLVKMAFDEPNGTFRGVSVSKVPLTLEPSE